ncbi:MAG: YbfB/YjiJ family MFS transporter [Pseudomonadota bacterium]|nr:YbfB/YjiJ family MFS transporter [Pseudomonadota bacterium]
MPRAGDDSRAALRSAAALALAAAVSLGLARFSYALLLAPMREDLGWSYLTAGAMNTVNAGGYLLGALLAPRWLARFDARTALLAGSIGAALSLAVHGAVSSDTALYLLRFVTGAASAATFVSGGLLSARVAATRPQASGLILGIYYGGTGLGIVVSALLVPPLVALSAAQGWRWAWVALGIAAAASTALIAAGTRGLSSAPAHAHGHPPFAWGPFLPGLLAYFMFGLGYIGYMTFVITLLREQQLGTDQIVVFFILLGMGVVASSWLWAGLLQRCRGGEALVLLNGLLAVATVLPVFATHPLAVYASGLLFGAVFLSVVASTTALVRHNLPAPLWPGGIAAFTIVFAAGQIIGPSAVGWIADGPGGLSRGLACSALVLAAGAACAWLQKPIAAAPRSIR